MLFTQTEQIPRLWYAKEGAYLFDKRDTFLVFYKDLYKKCDDIYEALNYLYKFTNEQPLFKSDLNEGIAVGCDRD